MLTNNCGLGNSGRDPAPRFVVNGAKFGPSTAPIFGDAIEFVGKPNSNAQMPEKSTQLAVGSQFCITFWTYVKEAGKDDPFIEFLSEGQSGYGYIHIWRHNYRSWGYNTFINISTSSCKHMLIH